MTSCEHKLEAVSFPVLMWHWSLTSCMMSEAWEWETIVMMVYIFLCVHHNTLQVDMVASVYCTVMATTHYTVGLMTLPLPSRVPRPCVFVTYSTNSVQILYYMQVTKVQRPVNKTNPLTVEERKILWSVNFLSESCKIKYNIQKMKSLATTQLNLLHRLHKAHSWEGWNHTPTTPPYLRVCVMKSWDLLICVRKEAMSHVTMVTHGQMGRGKNLKSTCKYFMIQIIQVRWQLVN